MEFINLKAQYQAYKQEIDKEIQEVLDSSCYIGGEKLSVLEKDLSDFVGLSHAIPCSNGTDALVLALMAIGIQPGDEVITTPFTFIAPAEAGAFLGATPVFVDIDEQTYNIDSNKIAEQITERTKCILPVSLFGQVADLDAINEIAKVYGEKYGHKIYVIEDAAQSFGATYKGRASCSLSDIACTSFFPAKPLGCYGDGGAVFTDQDDLAEKVRTILNHGQSHRYKYSRIGMNGRLDAIQAAVLKIKLQYFPQEIKTRQEIVQKYNAQLQDVILPYVETHNISTWAQYCIRVQNRAHLEAKCRDAGIPTVIYYPIPLHLQEVFAYLGYKTGDFPVSEQISNDIMALPMSAFLTDSEQDHIIDTVNTNVGS